MIGDGSDELFRRLSDDVDLDDSKNFGSWSSKDVRSLWGVLGEFFEAFESPMVPVDFSDYQSSPKVHPLDDDPPDFLALDPRWWCRSRP
jgi:hypothetical protein